MSDHDLVNETHRERPLTPGEELANAASHAVGLAAGLGFLPFLVSHAARHGTTADVVGAALFGTAVVMVYLTSTLYHTVRDRLLKRRIRVLDHMAIFVLIAGTYTPFTLGVLRGVWGWVLFGLVWGLAVAGLCLKLWGAFRFPRLSLTLYVAMGWLVVIAAKPLWDRMEPPGLVWLAAGGLAYTTGVFFYRARKLPYAHLVWHLFVLAGTACHAVAVLRYAF